MAGERDGILPLCGALAHVAVILRVTPCRAMLQVDEQGRRVGGVVGVAVKRGVGRGRELGFHVGSRQGDGVISRRCAFGRLVERRAVVVPVADAASVGGHDEYVAQIHAARAVEVGLGESPYNGVGVDIFRAIAPADSSGDRAGLYHSEWRCGSGKSVAVVGGSDEWIDVSRIIGCWCCRIVTCRASCRGGDDAGCCGDCQKFVHDTFIR